MKHTNFFARPVMALFAVALVFGTQGGCIGKNRNQAQGSEQEQAQTQEPQRQLYYNKATILNVRSAPSTSSEIVGKIVQGQDVPIRSIDPSTNFATIDFNGGEAYVSADFIAPRAASTTGKIVATKTGVGPIQLDMAASAVPAAYDGFYNNVKREVRVEYYDSDEEFTNVYMVFTLDGKPAAEAFLSDGKISSLTVSSPNVCSPEGVSPGMPVAALLDAGAKTQQWNDGSIYLILGELRFDGDGGLSQSGGKKVDEGYRTVGPITMTASDYTADAKVGAICIIR